MSLCNHINMEKAESECHAQKSMQKLAGKWQLNTHRLRQTSQGLKQNDKKQMAKKYF